MPDAIRVMLIDLPRKALNPESQQPVSWAGGHRVETTERALPVGPWDPWDWIKVKNP
jgi:hypothetical protein